MNRTLFLCAFKRAHKIIRYVLLHVIIIIIIIIILSIFFSNSCLRSEKVSFNERAIPPINFIISTYTTFLDLFCIIFKQELEQCFSNSS